MTAPHSDHRAPLPDSELELYRLLRRSAEPGIVIFDNQGRLLSANKAAIRLTGAHSTDSTAPLTLEALPEPLVAVVRDALAHPVKNREQTVVLAGQGAEKRRRVLWINVFSTAGSDSEGGMSVLTLHDLDAVRELEVKTDRLQQLASVGMLSAGVAHEVKNALVTVKTQAELVLEKQPDVESATLVRREVGRIDSLISQLLELAGPATPQYGPVAVHEVLHDALRLVQHQIRHRQLEEMVLLEAATDSVRGDARQLEQAFLNLLFNAVEAMDPGGRLLVRTELVVATEHISKFEPGRREQQLQVEVKDTGPGIPAEVLERLFTPFLTTKPGGTGLGLTITRRIIQEHHGAIKVESKTAKGATFRVLLPLLKA